MAGRRSVDECIAVLDEVIADAAANHSYLAVFPAMYRAVTTEVRRANAAGFFEDPNRLEALMSTFAGLYFDAVEAHRRGVAAPRCWDLAFTVAESRRRRSIIQHLLLGMNAHINLDLGIAAAGIAGPDELPSLYGDYLRVNEVLFTLVDQLQAGLNDVSPWMGLLDRVGLGIDETFMKLGLRTCRDRAWRFAERLVGEGEAATRELIAERDAEVRRLGRLVSARFSVFDAVSVIIKSREVRDVEAIVAAFDRQVVDLDRVAARVTEQLDQPPSADGSLRKKRGR